MPQKLPWSPWHRVVKLREDVRTGELSLADFAADLHDVMMQRGARPIYEDPARFFALTYPTFALRELARDVVLRLAGRNTKAVRQLELTYGGGKTHTLVALRHLAHVPPSLPSLPAVEQNRRPGRDPGAAGGTAWPRSGAGGLRSRGRTVRSGRGGGRRWTKRRVRDLLRIGCLRRHVAFPRHAGGVPRGRSDQVL